MSHVSHMRHALRLARRGLGETWPNPSVGAVVVKDGRIVGAARTAKGGRPHAEPQALQEAGELARGATLYVTLEPCSHHGATPPCVDAVIASGVACVVIACGDPNPKVAGAGIAALERAGVKVILDVCKQEAEELNAGFFCLLKHGRPIVNLKTASSLDGKIAMKTGESKWVTGEEARAYAHILRAQHDALITGINTILADDPLLTCRAPGMEDRSPIRVIMDSHLQLSSEARVVKSAHEVPTWVMTTPAATLNQERKIFELEKAGVKLFRVQAKDNKVDVAQALRLLGEQGITRVLVEAGSKLSTRFLSDKLVDELYWFRAPMVLGDDGLGVVMALPFYSLYECPRFDLKERITLGSDTLETYKLL